MRGRVGARQPLLLHTLQGSRLSEPSLLPLLRSLHPIEGEGLVSPPTHLRRALILWLPLLVAGGLLFTLGATTGDTRPLDVGAMLAGLGLFALLCDRAPQPHPTA